MSKECLTNCPKIITQIEKMELDNKWSGPLAVHPGRSAPRELMRLCQLSYDCDGVEVGVTVVSVGVLRKRTKEVQGVCPVDRQT